MSAAVRGAVRADLEEIFRREYQRVVAVAGRVALSAWGFSWLAATSGGSALTSGEARLTASILLNLVMFGFSLIAALGTAFLAGPTLAGETESGIALAVLARPIRRSAVLLGKWLGLVVFGTGFVVLAGLAPVPRHLGDRRWSARTCDRRLRRGPHDGQPG